MMSVLVDYVILKWTAVFLIIISLLTVWVRRKLSYWEKKKIPHLKPNFPWGNLENVFVKTTSIGEIFWDFYDKIKEQGAKYAGFYMSLTPVFVPIDPEFIKNVLIKDFQSFHARGFYNNEKDQPMSVNMFTVDGSNWRTSRYKFSPTFTSGKIKSMYKLMVDCSYPLCEMVSNFAKSKKPINVKDAVKRFTTDTIGSCAFGINCNSFTEDPTLYEMVKVLMDKSTKIQRFVAMNTFRSVCRFFKMGLFINEPLKYFGDVITDTFEQRKKNLVHRPDFLQLLKDIQEKKNNEDFDLSLNEIQAQSLLFFIAGYETSSTALSFLLLELAENVEIQEILRREILEVSSKHKGITYDALQEMKYLQCVIDETLRKYPPLTVLNRTCTESYTLPNGELLNKGSNIIIPILAIHRDPEFYPNPDVFDPDRFAEENKKKIQPYTYLPFGDGPRNCIGSRFGLLQMKVAVAHLIAKFKFTINKNMDTTRRYTTNFFMTLAQDILLDVEEI